MPSSLVTKNRRVRVGSYDPTRATRTIWILVGTLVVVAAVFMTYDLKGSLSYALELRARKLGALCVVGACLAYASVLFHTITGNRILTPSLIGLDALYILIQTGAAFVLGTFAFLQIDVRIRFVFEVVVMLCFAAVLQRRFLARQHDDLFLLVLVGIVMGTMFAGLTSLAARMIDPNEFITLQDQFFASFGAVDRNLLILSIVVIVVCIGFTIPLLNSLDAAALGRVSALNLGVDHEKLVARTLAIVVVLTSVATALVGPVTFLGLIISNLAYRITGTFRHRYTLPVATLLAMVALVVGQFVLEELLHSATRLSIIVGFVGGVSFLVLLLGEAEQ